MMEISEILFFAFLIGSFIVGMFIGIFSIRDYRKYLEKEYDEKHQQIYNTIRKETRTEWSKGWDAAYSYVGKMQKAYYLWFREHGYTTEEIDSWLEKYLKGQED